MAQSGEYSTRLALLPIITEGTHGKASLSDVFDDVAAVTSRRLGINLISNEEMFSVSQQGVGQAVQECGPDVKCIASKLRLFRARFGLVVSVDFSLDPPVYGIQLVDTDDVRLVKDGIGELDAKKPRASLRAAVEETLEKAGYVLAARIVVDVDPPNAILRLEDGTEPDKGTPNVFTLAPGKYTITAAADGHDAGTTEAEVAGGATTQVTLELDEQTSIVESPWLWIGVGVGVAAITTGVIIGTRQVERCLCFTFENEQCTCE